MSDSPFQYKPWDSEFFNQNIFELDIHDAYHLTIDHVRQSKNTLIQVKVPVENLLLLDKLQSFNFQIVETEMYFEKQLMPISTTNLPEKVAVLDDLEAVMKLAAHAFTYSRFRPSWFKQDDSSRFYSEWAKNAILKKYDDICFKIEEDSTSELFGFITGKKINAIFVKIGLICVSEIKRGKKIGADLLRMIENWSVAEGMSKIAVATQGSNLMAVSFYLRNGYQLKGINYWMYLKNDYF